MKEMSGLVGGWDALLSLASARVSSVGAPTSTAFGVLSCMRSFDGDICSWTGFALGEFDGHGGRGWGKRCGKGLKVIFSGIYVAYLYPAQNAMSND